jgi:ribosome-associated heat shock protein Hsp15
MHCRLDKWLWAARFYKTRSLAAQAVDAGQARIDDAHVKPSRMIKPGDRISVNKGGLTWDVTVTAISERRGSAADAAALYQEAADSLGRRVDELARRKATAATTPTFPGRPTKRQRRKLQEFLDEG